MPQIIVVLGDNGRHRRFASGPRRGDRRKGECLLSGGRGDRQHRMEIQSRGVDRTSYAALLSDPVVGIKFSQDIVPVTDLKVNPGRVVRHASEAHRPVLLTCRGRGVAVVQSVADFEAAEDERDFMRAVVAGLADLEAGREWSLAEVKERLGLA